MQISPYSSNMLLCQKKVTSCFILPGVWLPAIMPYSPYSPVAGTILLQPYEFTAGEPVSGPQAKKSDAGSAGGLFVGGSGPKPPPALSTAVLGMKPGGKVSQKNLRTAGYTYSQPCTCVENPAYPACKLPVPYGAVL